MLEERLPQGSPPHPGAPTYTPWREDIQLALVETLAELNRLFAVKGVLAGCTATLVLQVGWLLTTANLGDSRAIMDTGVECLTPHGVRAGPLWGAALRGLSGARAPPPPAGAQQPTRPRPCHPCPPRLPAVDHRVATHKGERAARAGQWATLWLPLTSLARVRGRQLPLLLGRPAGGAAPRPSPPPPPCLTLLPPPPCCLPSLLPPPQAPPRALDNGVGPLRIWAGRAVPVTRHWRL